jgi:hypothetical protein
MSQVISFDNFTPAARFDGIPWDSVVIEEAATPAGAWAVIDTLPIAPADTDPADPQPRDLTTANASDTDGLWYRLTFYDAFGQRGQPSSPIQNSPAGTYTADGPCQDWICDQDILDCCGVGTDVILGAAAQEASGLLYQLSGSRFSGVCQRTVRPCPGNCGCWTPRWPEHETPIRGCRPLSSVKLAGYPVQAIIDVTIDGVTVDPSEYRLDRNQYLLRLNDASGNRQLWPGCQDLGKDSGDDTFFVTYSYGVAPPVAGVEAAKQLGCELVKACTAETSGDCDLPPGTSRVTRQGLTIEAETLGLFLSSGQTGLAHIDAFLAVYGGNGHRPAVIWSPEIAPFAQEA